MSEALRDAVIPVGQVVPNPESPVEGVVITTDIAVVESEPAQSENLADNAGNTIPITPETSLDAATLQLLTDEISVRVAKDLTAKLPELASGAVEDKIVQVRTTVVEAGRAHVASAREAADILTNSSQTAAADLHESTRASTEQAIEGGMAAADKLRQHVDETAARFDATREVIDEQNHQVLSALRKTADDARAGIKESTDKAAASADEAVRAAKALTAAGKTVVRTAVVEALQEMVSGDKPDLELVTSAKSKLAPRHAHAPLLEVVIQAGIPAYLHGEAGSGKSTGARLVAGDFDVPFRHLALGPTTSKADLLGYRDAGGKYQGTGFRDVVENGGIFLFDEIDNGHPGSMAVMNSSLANRHTEFPDEFIEHHRTTRFVAAANTIGKGADAQYVGRNRLDAATLDRFAFIRWDIDPALEEAIVLGQPLSPTKPIDLAAGRVPTAKEWLDTVRKYREKAPQFSQLVTTRAAEYGVRLARLGIGHNHLVEMLIFKGVNQDIKTKWNNGMPRR